MPDASAAGGFLQFLAERAASDPAYFAWVVRSYAEVEGRPTADVLAQMSVAESCALDFLLSLRPAGERFADMLKAICVRVGADERAVLVVLREVEALVAFRAGSPSSDGATDAGLLMAARMREEEPRSRRAGEDSEARRADEHGGNGGGDAR